MALTPMVLTARMIKQDHPHCKVAFIGPCAAKKLEASRKSVRSDVDFVLTFEEVMGMFEAKDIHFDDFTETEELTGASADGRGFAISGGVAQAVVNCIHQEHPDLDVKVHAEESLQKCRQMLKDAKKVFMMVIYWKVWLVLVDVLQEQELYSQLYELKAQLINLRILLI